jgi:hypothetical protein
LERKILQANGVEKIKTRILYAISFFFENRAVCEMAWKNIAEPDRPQMTIWRTRIACWITKATEAHSVKYLLLFYGKNDYRKKPESYVYTCIAGPVQTSLSRILHKAKPP